MKDILKVYDTSALLSLSDSLVIDETCYISAWVMRELENIKSAYSKDAEVKAQARQVVRVLRTSNFTSNVTNFAAIEKNGKKVQ